MNIRLKKSQIIHWWVAEQSSKLSFANIFEEKALSKKLIVVGYYGEEKELATSQHIVVNVTKKGIITAQGSFYPFEEANALYLQFLIEISKPNTIVATYWDYAEDDDKYVKDKNNPKILIGTKWGEVERKNYRLIANIMRNGTKEMDITFDFKKNENDPLMLRGYSKELSSNVVLCTFQKRSFCIIIGIPKNVENDILKSTLVPRNEKEKIIKEFRKIYFSKKRLFF